MRNIIITIFFMIILIAGAGGINTSAMDEKKEVENITTETATAIFAGGCFWCTESDFEKVTGVLEAVSGYTGGRVANPSYEQVSSGETGHFEAVKVYYNPDLISYKELLEVFWRHVNPTDNKGQFVDRGQQYESAVFYSDKYQLNLIKKSKEILEKSGIFNKPIVTKILKRSPFYKAEEYHQDYYKTHPFRYKFYRSRSGRDEFLKKTWKNHPVMKKKSSINQKYIKPDDGVLKKKLTKLQYNVVRKDKTEPPFKNEYWDNHEQGIYVDIVSGEPLFGSVDKFDSGTGWPSFTKPIDPKFIVKLKDKSLFMTRTEVRSRYGDSHLGHVFGDGPAPTGLRYCINSASLRFIPKSDMKKEGYEYYIKIFKNE